MKIFNGQLGNRVIQEWVTNYPLVLCFFFFIEIEKNKRTNTWS